MKTKIDKKNPGKILGYLMAVAMVLFANVFAYSQNTAPYCETFDSGVSGWTNNGWVNNQYGTASSNTGPTDDITGGGFYMYYETSAGYLPVVDITSAPIDISGLATPTLAFYNHMWGASIGVLNVYINGNLEWTQSGDQGNQWNYVQVDLSSYIGTNVSIMFEAYYGGNFTGDIAIDQVCVDEFNEISGCTDPVALNYNPNANTDDGSCTFCTGTSLYLNMGDTYGDGSNAGTWTFTGSNTGIVYGPYTISSTTAFSAVELLCMDDDCYDIVVGGGTWDIEMFWTITDLNGDTLASSGDPLNGGGAGTFLGGLGVGVVCPIYGCTDNTALNFDSLANADDGSCAFVCDPYVAYSSVVSVPSCNGAFDASVSAGVNNSFGNDFWLWDNGATTSTVTGLAAGTYSCTITDSVNLCTSTTTITVNPTPAISIVGTTFDAVPGQNNGGVVALQVSGGTPCYDTTNIALAGASSTSTQWASNVFDVTASSDLQITSIDQPFMSGVGSADVYYRVGSGQGYEDDPNGWILAGSATVLSSFIGDIASIPVSLNLYAGETICIYVNGVGINTVFGAGTDSTWGSNGMSNIVSSDANLSIHGGFATGGAPGSGTTYPSAGSYDFGGFVNYSLASYFYLWTDSLASTTQNVTNLGLGPISVTVTDCNGCTSSGAWFILTNYVYGCMDALASNYDPAANTSWDQDTTGNTPACLYDGCTDSSATNYDATANNDDGSCLYNCMHPNSGSFDDELTVTFTPDWFSSENSWYILDAINGDTALASAPYANGGAIDIQTLCAMDGCYYIDGYDSFGDGWTGGILDIVDYNGNSLISFTVPSGSTFASSSVFTVGAANCTLGCTDSTYNNFNVLATIDDGSCADSIFGCTDPAANNYTPYSNIDDGSCCYENVILISCTGGAYQSEVSWVIIGSLGDTVVTGGAPYNGTVCLIDDCFTVDMYDSYGDGWNGNTITMTDGSGNVIGSGGLTAGSSGSFTFSTGSALCPVYGCTDSLASNFDPNANIDDTTCCYDNYIAITTGIDYFGSPFNWSFNGMDWTVSLLGDSTPALIGSTIYGGTLTGDDADGCLPDGCYEFVANDASGWIGSYAWFSINGTMYSGPANGGSYGVPAYQTFALGSASCPIQGCTDSLASNYDPAATYDNGSCVYPCLENEITWNMYDSWGDGWNGATYTLSDAFTGAVVASGGLATGSFEVGTLCVPTGCYTLTVGGGTYDSEITFDFDTSLVAASVGTYIVSVGGAACTAGCTDSVACNYDPNANVDNGSCDLTSCYGCLDPLALNYDSTMLYDDGSCFYCQLTASSVVINSTGNCDGSVDLTINGSYCTPANLTYVWSNGLISEDITSACAGTYTVTATDCYGCSVTGSATVIVSVDYGCTDSLAFNYDPTANTDDGSCVAVVNGCTDSLNVNSGLPNVNYNVSANVDDGSCTDTIIGCTDPAASNYIPYSNIDDGSCCYFDVVTLTLTDSYGDGWNANSLTVDGVNYALPDVNGDYTTTNVFTTYPGGYTNTFNLCLDLSVCIDVTYNATGAYTTENGWTITDANGTVLNSGVAGQASDSSFGGCPIYGCIDSLASNYDPLADTNDGSCCFDNSVTVSFYDSYGDGWNGAQMTVYNDGVFVTSGSLAGGSFYTDDLCLPDGCYDVTVGGGSYDSEITFDFGSLIGAAVGTYVVPVGLSACVYGCTDPNAINYDPNVTIDDGSCIAYVYGCTDAAAFNYDPLANTDDGSCVPYTYGCTNPNAINYNPVVNTDDGSCVILGCDDPAALNYDSTVTINDGTCIYLTCAAGVPTGVFASDIIHDRATINWDNMNSSACFVDQYRVRYREVGTSSWSQKTLGAPANSCTFAALQTDKRILGLSPSTAYEYQMKAWYCNGYGNSGWGAMYTFTTLDNCPNVGGLSVSTPTTTKATFTWNGANGLYSFVRLKARIDTISNPSASDFFQIGGAGVAYGTWTKDKNGLTPGQSYRGQARTYCDPNGGPWKSPAWTALVYWTQPTVRIEGGDAITNLDVYPNPSKDVFNVTFTSEDVQDLEVRVINIVGDIVHTEELQQFVGEYTKSIDLATYTKGVYFLEITTNTGVVNKKLILQ